MFFVKFLPIVVPIGLLSKDQSCLAPFDKNLRTPHANDFWDFLKFTGLLESAEEGGFVIKCIELPVATEGETKEEALANLKEAIEEYIEVRTEIRGKSKTKTKRELVEFTVGKTSSPLVA